MDLIVIGLVAAIASLLTFFSGFGLGTILTPVLSVFFPIEVAIAITGIVHLLNNLFKGILVRKEINWRIGWKFGSVAIVGAVVGALLLVQLPTDFIWCTYKLGNKLFEIRVVNLIIAFLMIGFALFEMLPYFKKVQFKENRLYIGGFLSGFFGGFSGHQGALRSAFLLKCGLSKKEFIATGILIACFVDFMRLSVYSNNLNSIDFNAVFPQLSVATLAAFLGALVGSKLLDKVTVNFIQWTVSTLIILLALGLGLGMF